MSHLFPPLETARLLLRPLVQDDLEFLFRHFSDPQVYRYLLDDDPVTTRAEAQAILDFYVPQLDKPYNRWLIVRKNDGRPIGTCGFHKWQKDTAKLRSATIWKPLRGGRVICVKHYALPCVMVLWKWAEPIEAMVYPDNLASLRFLQHLGFQKEGLLRQSTRQGDRFYDHWLLALLQEEWKIN